MSKNPAEQSPQPLGVQSIPPAAQAAIDTLLGSSSPPKGKAELEKRINRMEAARCQHLTGMEKPPNLTFDFPLPAPGSDWPAEYVELEDRLRLVFEFWNEYEHQSSTQLASGEGLVALGDNESSYSSSLGGKRRPGREMRKMIRKRMAEMSKPYPSKRGKSSRLENDMRSLQQLLHEVLDTQIDCIDYHCSREMIQQEIRDGIAAASFDQAMGRQLLNQIRVALQEMQSMQYERKEQVETTRNSMLQLERMLQSCSIILSGIRSKILVSHPESGSGAPSCEG